MSLRGAACLCLLGEGGELGEVDEDGAGFGVAGGCEAALPVPAAYEVGVASEVGGGGGDWAHDHVFIVPHLGLGSPFVSPLPHMGETV